MERELPINKFSNDVILDMREIMIVDMADKEYSIFVKKETGSWATINKSKRNIVQELFDEDITLGKYKKLYPNDIEFLNILFESGILKINGKSIIREDLFENQCQNSQTYPCAIVVKYTRKCNLRCSYCYAYSDINQNSKMSNNTIMYILKKMIKIYGDKKFSLILHGGEPVLRYKDMILLMKDINNLSKNIEVRLQTNATLITKEIADFFKQENIKVGISVDGFDDATNIQRCYTNNNSSLKESLKGLDNLLLSGIVPGMISVITASNQDRLVEHFDFYAKKGIKSFVFNTFFPAGRGINDKYITDMDNLVLTNLKLIDKINTMNSQQNNPNDYVYERNIANLINNLTSWERKYMCAFSPCGAGRMTLGFDTDGSIYPCDDFISQSDFCIGNVFEIDNIKEAIQKSSIIKRVVNHNVNNTKECSECPWKRICTSHCASDSFFYNNTFNMPHIKCLFMKKIIPQIIDLLYSNKINYQHFLL